MKVSIIMGSESDRKVGDQVFETLRDYEVECDYVVISAHRDPIKLNDYLQTCLADVYIAVAGLSAALPGYVASRTQKPVIGVPRNVRLGGLDALLSTVQMPPGVPVACVGIDNGKNAALLALRILALYDGSVEKEIKKNRKRKT